MSDYQAPVKVIPISDELEARLKALEDLIASSVANKVGLPDYSKVMTLYSGTEASMTFEAGATSPVSEEFDTEGYYAKPGWLLLSTATTTNVADLKTQLGNNLSMYVLTGDDYEHEVKVASTGMSVVRVYDAHQLQALIPVPAGFCVRIDNNTKIGYSLSYLPFL